MGTSFRRPFVVVFGLDELEGDAGKLAALMNEFLGNVHVDDRDLLVQGFLLLSRGGFPFIEAAAYDDFDVGATHTACGAAAVHGGVAAAEDDDAR